MANIIPFMREIQRRGGFDKALELARKAQGPASKVMDIVREADPAGIGQLIPMTPEPTGPQATQDTPVSPQEERFFQRRATEPRDPLASNTEEDMLLQRIAEEFPEVARLTEGDEEDSVEGNVETASDPLDKELETHRADLERTIELIEQGVELHPADIDRIRKNHTRLMDLRDQRAMQEEDMTIKPLAPPGQRPPHEAPELSGKPYELADRARARGMKPHQRAFLDAIAGGESNGKYNIRFTPDGGVEFSDFSRHPGIAEPIPGGFKGEGSTSTAAGRYQFLQSTWDSLGGGDFSPENQDRRAWQLAVRDYRTRTGRDLDADLQEGGLTPQIINALEPTWEAFSRNTDRHMATYEQSLWAAGEDVKKITKQRETLERVRASKNWFQERQKPHEPTQEDRAQALASESLIIQAPQSDGAGYISEPISPRVPSPNDVGTGELLTDPRSGASRIVLWDGESPVSILFNSRLEALHALQRMFQGNRAPGKDAIRSLSKRQARMLGATEEAPSGDT